LGALGKAQALGAALAKKLRRHHWPSRQPRLLVLVLVLVLLVLVLLVAW
jgi:hypothetical protein